jgi:DNA-binding transcriptional regulator YiaG
MRLCYVGHMRETAFRRWRKQLKFTQDEAAQVLGCSKSQVANWDAGVDRSSGNPAIPPRSIRVLMTLQAQGQSITPWPEK